MKATFFVIMFFLILLSSIGVVVAEAPPHYFILNDITKECSERNSFSKELPSNWNIVDVDHEDMFFVVKTSLGDCQFAPDEYTLEGWGDCCTHLGLEFVNPDDFNQDYVQTLRNDYLCGVVDEHYETAMAIDTIAGQCAFFHCRFGNAGPSKVYENGLELYGAQQQYYSAYYNSSAGDCVYSIYNPQECCDQLGYTFIHEFDLFSIPLGGVVKGNFPFLFFSIVLVGIILFIASFRHFLKRNKK